MRILFFEDSTPIRKPVTKALKASGFAVDATGDGFEGWQMAQDHDYDVIILDSPALDGIADAAVLAHSVDGVLLVADRRRLRAPELARALESLEKSGANVLGVVLNHTPVHLPGSAQGSSTTTEASVPLLSVTSKSSELPFGTLNT